MESICIIKGNFAVKHSVLLVFYINLKILHLNSYIEAEHLLSASSDLFMFRSGDSGGLRRCLISSWRLYLCSSVCEDIIILEYGIIIMEQCLNMGCSWSCKMDSYSLAVIGLCRAINRPNDSCVIMDSLPGLIPGSRYSIVSWRDCLDCNTKNCFKTSHHTLGAKISLIIITFLHCFHVSEDMLVNSIFIMDPIEQTEFSALSDDSNVSYPTEW